MTEGAPQLAALARQLKLTRMQRAFAQGLAEGDTQADAARTAGVKEDYVYVQGSKWAKMPKVQEYAAAVAKLARTQGKQGLEQQTAQALANVVDAQTRELARVEAEIMDAREVQVEMSKLGRAPLPADKVPPRIKLGALEALARIHGLDKGAAAQPMTVNVERLLVAVPGPQLGQAYRAMLGGDGDGRTDGERAE